MLTCAHSSPGGEGSTPKATPTKRAATGGDKNDTPTKKARTPKGKASKSKSATPVAGDDDDEEATAEGEVKKEEPGEEDTL